MKRLTFLLCTFTLLCTCALAPSYCSAQQPGSDPELTLTPHLFVAADGRETQTEMGEFEVPESRNNPDGRKLTLRFVRFKSTNPNPGAPIVYLAGGPGGSGVNAAKHTRHDLFLALRSVADVIAFEQRGTGLSDGPSEYPGFWSLDFATPMTEENAAPAIQKATREAADFFAKNGSDLAAYNSNESADDLNDLRRALGAEKLSLWAISYGTHLALTTLKRHEKHLDRLVLAGVEGYDHTVKMPADQQALLTTIDKMLKENPKTASIFPDFLGDVAKLIDQVGKKPVMVTSKHPATGNPVEVAVGEMELRIILSWTLRGPENFQNLPLAVKQMLKGNFSTFASYAIYTKLGKIRGMSMGMDLASGISPARRQLLQQQAKTTLLGDAINFPYLYQYDALKELDAGKEFRAPYPSDIPVLCISGTLDGRTPPGNAEETLKYLPNGRHLVLEGAGHSDPLFLSSPRILEVMEAFFSGEQVENERIVLPEVEWELPEEE